LIDALTGCNQFQTDEDIFNRGLAFKRFFKEYLSSNPVPAGEKIAIVCLCQFVCALTSTHFEGEGEKSVMIGCECLNHC
jgi:hypothetical protein